MPLFVEEASGADAEALAELEKVCLNGAWNRRAFARALGQPHFKVLVLRSVARTDEGGPGIAAYCAMSVVADEMQVLTLAVAPAFRGRGLGRFLLRIALAAGRRRGAETAFLEVRRSNATACHIYDALGFREVGRRRGYYKDPLEDALVLARSWA